MKISENYNLTVDKFFTTNLEDRLKEKLENKDKKPKVKRKIKYLGKVSLDKHDEVFDKLAKPKLTRKESYKKMMQKCVKIQCNEKALLAKGLLENENIEKLEYVSDNNIITQLAKNMPTTIKAHEQYTAWIIRQNLFGIFTCYEGWTVGEKGSHPCPLFKGNFAWISVDNKGIYRLFSKKPNGHSISMNVFDLIEIVEGKEIGKKFGLVGARRHIATLLNHTYRERREEVMQLEIYNNNLDTLTKADTDMIESFPELYEYTKNYQYVLEYLNAYARTHIIKDGKLKKDSVFYVSTTYIADHYTKAQSEISRAINCFAVLGLVNKIANEIVPENVKEQAEKLYEYKNIKHRQNKDKGYINYNNINFYVLPKYDLKALYEADKRVKKLKKVGITKVKSITKENTVKAFNQDFADKVYGVKPLTFNQRIEINTMPTDDEM